MVTKNTINFSEIDNPTLPISDDVLFIALQLDTSGAYRDVKVARRDILLGRVQTWLGAWQEDYEYSAYDCVSYNGSSYIAVGTSTGVTPSSDDTLWNIFAERGEQGIDGDLSAGAAQTISDAIAAANVAVASSQGNASAAAASASSATTAANTATQKAEETATYVGQAQTSANSASNSASEAAGSALTSASASNSVFSTLHQFKIFFVGSYDSDPQADGNGNALVNGAVYINTSTGKLRVYFNDAWADYDADYQSATNAAEASATAAAASAGASATSANAAAASASSASSSATESASSATVAASAQTNAQSSATAAANSAQIAQSALAGSTTSAVNLVGSYKGVIVAGDEIFTAITSQGLTLPAGLANSYAYAKTAPTSDYVCPIEYTTAAGVTTQVGTVTFSAGTTVGVFSFTADVITSPGDIITILAPMTVDGTFANPSFGITARGSVFDGYVSKKTAAYTPLAIDRKALLVMDITADATNTLPTPTGYTGDFPNGWRVKFLNISSHTVTIAVPSGVYLNGTLNGTYSLSNSKGIEVTTDGNDWYLTGG